MIVPQPLDLWRFGVSDLTRISESRMQALNFFVSHTGESAGRAVSLMAKPSCRRWSKAMITLLQVAECCTCRSWLSNGPGPGVVLSWAHEVRRRARYARADASRSGIHASGEECAMPAWVHSEWRLLHAYVPACSGSRPEGREMPE